MTDFNLKKKIAESLKNAGIEAFDFEAKEIVSFADSKADALKMLEERISGKPLQYILGEWEFMGLDFKVGPGVLVPRADTEIAVETALNVLKPTEKKQAIDVCAGSGCIGISLSKIGKMKVSFVEKSREAIEYLNKNLELNKVSGEVFEIDVLESTDFGTDEKVDLIISNPPYIKSAVVPTLEKEVLCEPQMALDGGEDGLLFYRKITETSKKHLKKNGVLMFEIGFDQQEEVSEILKVNGFYDITSVKDYGGNFRVVYGKF